MHSALRVAYEGFEPSDAVLADLARLEVIWDHAKRTVGGDGPWLCGAHSAADAFFAPVAARIARALEAPLEVLIVRKLGVPGHEEFAMGALASG